LDLRHCLRPYRGDNAMSRIEVHHTYQGWAVVGGNLPHGTAWAIFDSEGEAREFAWELAQDLGVDYLPNRVSP